MINRFFFFFVLSSTNRTGAALQPEIDTTGEWESKLTRTQFSNGCEERKEFLVFFHWTKVFGRWKTVSKIACRQWRQAGYWISFQLAIPRIPYRSHAMETAPSARMPQKMRKIPFCRAPKKNYIMGRPFAWLESFVPLFRRVCVEGENLFQNRDRL